MFWLLGIALLLVMLAALSVATAIGVPDSSLLDAISPSLLAVFGIVIALMMMFLHYRQLDFFSNRKISIIGRQGLLMWLACLLIAISILQVMTDHNVAQNSQIRQSLRVQAVVRIDGLSDSVMTDETGYRQVAIIEAMQPMTTKLSPTELNQLAKQALEGQSSWQADKLTDPPRVLLQAYPKPKTPLTQPTSKLLSTFQKKRQIEEGNLAANLNGLMPNERRLMTLTIQPLVQSTELAASGFDSYRWLRSRHIDGTAQVQAVSSLAMTDWQSATDDRPSQKFRQAIDQGRFKLRAHFYQNWQTYTEDEQQARAVTLSLLTGDRSLINRDTKDLYQIAGISHLLAISGTHVLFLALILAGIVSKIIDRFWTAGYQYLSRWQWRFLVMVAAAFLYALFTGFDVPAARTAWTLLAVGLVRLTLLPISTGKVLLALAVVMAWLDPMVLWQAGYWLSFIAVALLLAYEEKRSRKSPEAQAYISWLTRAWQAFKGLFRLQCWLFLALLPVTLLLFGKVSLWGLVVNLFAIGLFGWVLVPLNLLAGVIYLLSPVAADQLWRLVVQIVQNLHHVIAWMTELGAAKQVWLSTTMTLSLLLIACAAMLPWILPRGLLSRYLALPALFLFVMTVNAQNQALLSVPTLFILPTGDRLTSAVLLQYPLAKKDSSVRQISWLILSDHRAIDKVSWQQRPSHLDAQTLTATLSDSLQRLKVANLDGIIVQSAAQSRDKPTPQESPPLLPTVAAKLAEQITTHNYWQAGNLDDLPKGVLSAQPCQVGKTWQIQETNSPIRIEAMTGWGDIADSRIWDCSLQIDSQLPIEIVHFNAAHPKQSAKAERQLINTARDESQNKSERLILDGSRHPYSWELWKLLCGNQARHDGKLTWLTHSRSPTSSEILSKLAIDSAITYDKKPLEAALTVLSP